MLTAECLDQKFALLADSGQGKRHHPATDGTAKTFGASDPGAKRFGNLQQVFTCHFTIRQQYRLGAIVAPIKVLTCPGTGILTHEPLNNTLLLIHPGTFSLYSKKGL